eukprot:1155150-Pelagomonas_calceolata.AAC.4
MAEQVAAVAHREGTSAYPKHLVAVTCAKMSVAGRAACKRARQGECLDRRLTTRWIHDRGFWGRGGSWAYGGGEQDPAPPEEESQGVQELGGQLSRSPLALLLAFSWASCV